MVSEGVDIPRLRVGVYATTTSTELFFRQAVGRFVRWTRGVPRQRAWLFIPDDERLRLHAARVAEQRRHSLRRSDGAVVDVAGAEERELGADDQMSLFAAISAVATDPTGLGDDEVLDDEDDGDAEEFELTLAPLPPLGGVNDVAAAAGEPVLTRREEKKQLRDATAKVARELARRAGLTHAQVNAELNRLSGVQRVSEATVAQLERRYVAADRWLAKT
jgi:hypothetical protein